MGSASMSVAWLFPGQGSQYVGMAAGWLDRSAEARRAVETANQTLGFDVAALIADGPEATLADTHNQQPAVLAASIATLAAARDQLPEPTFVAGHSLGEYSALVAAESLAYPDALRLVRERGRLMRLAGERSPGGMAAVLGLPDEVVEATCDAIEGVQVANYNAPGQVVISGTREAVERASEKLAEAGAKRVVRLPITIAAHSRLMAPIAESFRQAVDAAPVGVARVPVMANVSATPIVDEADLRDELARQLMATVRWTASVRRMLDAGVRTFYEVGPRTVLTDLVRRIGKADGVEGISLVSLDAPD